MSLHRLLVVRGWLLALLGYTGLARAETLVVAAEVWCSINCKPGSARPSIFVELAREIFAKSGNEVTYQALNWPRVLHTVRRGQLHAVIGAQVQSAADFIFGKTPVLLSRNCFYTPQDSTWVFTGIASPAQQRLGVINDYSYGDELNT
jgi:polar amino acid transport system substrate-binding protein